MVSCGTAGVWLANPLPLCVAVPLYCDDSALILYYSHWTLNTVLLILYCILQVVDDAIGAGVDGYDGDTRTALQKAVKGLRLPVQAALDIASKAVSEVFPIEPFLVRLRA